MGIKGCFLAKDELQVRLAADPHFQVAGMVIYFLK
jgi:hypothetical protein